MTINITTNVTFNDERLPGSPQVVTWFVKDRPVGKNWFNLFKQDIVDPIRAVCPKSSFYLCNLNAWNRIAGKQQRKQKFDAIKILTEPNGSDFKPLQSSDFVKFMQSDEQTDLVKAILKERDFIWKRSDGEPNTKKTLREVFGTRRSFPLREGKDVGVVDTAKAYSALQYLEGLFYIRKIALENLQKDPINIVFILPNDEYTYYYDKNNSFQQDLQSFLRASKGFSSRRVSVSFIPFKWGDGKRNRPYLSGGKPVSRSKLTELLTRE